MNTTRRNFVITLAVAIPSMGCNSPTAPTSATNLLARVQSIPGLGNARRVPYGTNGAASIEINGHVKWIFLVNNQMVGEINQTQGASPTLDVSKIEVPVSSVVVAREL